MSFAIVTQNSAITPGRDTRLHLDVTEPCVSEDGINVLRRGVEVARGAAGGIVSASDYSHMKFWASGCWTLAPIQGDLSNVHESTVGSAFVLDAGGWVFVNTQDVSGETPMLKSVPHFCRSSIGGAYYTSAVPTSGDHFLRKRIPSAGSTDPAALASNAGFDSAMPPIAYNNADVPMDRVGVTVDALPANQGLCLRWKAQGTNLSSIRYLFSVYFGQYAVIIGGTGYAELWEYCRPSEEGEARWVGRQIWRYAPEGAAPSTANAMAIFPHRAPDGSNFIAFSNLTTSGAAKVNSQARSDSNTASVGEFIYRADPTIRGNDVDESPGSVTKSDKVRIDIRRDLRVDVQISTLAFQTSGILIDDSVPNGGGAASNNTAAVTVQSLATLPTGCTITAVTQDGDTGVTFVPGTDVHPQAKFTFAGSGTDTPILWGYAMRQAPLIETSAPGAFSLAGKSYQIEGYAGDPQTENASIVVNDVAMVYPRLQYREYFSARLDTLYTPPGAGSPVTVSLFRGSCVSNRSRQIGCGRVTTTGYPDPYWRQYTLGLQGMWNRLAEKVQPGFFRSYAMDPADPSLPWKVTDAARDLIRSCGFADSQINIPDLGYRLWPAYKDQQDSYQVTPQSSLAGALVHMLREELGCYLHFEPNAGTDGQWELIFGTQPNIDGSFDPVYHFVGAPVAAWPQMPYHPASYPENTTLYTKIEFHPSKPDFNSILVTTGIPGSDANSEKQVVQYADNPLSYHAPGFTVSPDPNHPDYIGHRVRYTVIAPHLTCDKIEDTRAAVIWTARRYYDFLCHAQLILHITAPLGFIYDASIASGSSSGYRPLRFQDPVSLNGAPNYLIKSVRMVWSSDRVQMAEYELIAPFPGQHFFGADGREFYRREAKRMSQRTVGMATHSGQFGVFAPAAHREQAHMDLPVVRRGFGSIQNADGSFHSIAGWNTWDGSAG